MYIWVFLKTISGTYFFVLLQVVKQLNCTLSEEEKEHSSKNDRAISKCLKEADLQKLLRVKVRPMTKLHHYLIFFCFDNFFIYSDKDSFITLDRDLLKRV